MIAALAAVVAVLAVTGVLVGIPGTGKTISRLFAGTTADVITYKVLPANLPIEVTERGSLESSENLEAYCKVEGPATTIIFILPEGKDVKKNDLVVELDSSTLKDQLTNQEIATKSAEAAYQNAKLTREVAQIAVIEYEQGIFKQDMQTVEGEIALADSDQKRAVERLAWTQNMHNKKYVSDGALTSERLALKKAEFTYEQATTKKTVLTKYTHDKTVKELESEVEKTKSDELAKQQTWDLEKTKEAKLRRQIENCKILAPGDGIIVYANDPNRFGGSQTPQIEEGASVRERQKVFSLPNISKMRVNTKVHESMIDKLSPGLPARIKVESFGDKTLLGTVDKVQPLPDPSSMFASDVKVYTTHVRINQGLPGLRPGMSAQVDILVEELKNVLSVPLQAVLQYKDKDHIAVKNSQGKFDFREVTLGKSNEKLVEVKKGVGEGELVALNPVALMSQDEQREAFGSSGKDASKKDWGDTATKIGTNAPGGDPTKAAPDAKKAGGTPGAGPGAPGGADKAKAKGKRAGGGMGKMMDPATREKMKNASPEERRKMLEERGVPPEMIDGILERMNNPGAGGGFGGPPGGGFGGGGGRRGGDGGGEQP